MREEDTLLQKRYLEWAENSYKNSIYYFTGFLSVSEINILFETPQISPENYQIFGGVEGCERQMVRFGSSAELGYEIPFPIVIIKIEPLIQKFADDFTHRDFLGALMNLGIKREVIGDIIVNGKDAYLFVAEKMAEYVQEQLTKVKHTHVRCKILKDMPIDPIIKREEEEVLVSSLRVDGMVAKLYHLSRNQSLELFRERNIFVNGRLCENNSYFLKPEDIISVRGYGKCIFKKQLYETKKGKCCLLIERYV